MGGELFGPQRQHIRFFAGNCVNIFGFLGLFGANIFGPASRGVNLFGNQASTYSVRGVSTYSVRGCQNIRS